MPASAARPLPGPGPPLASVFLLLLAVLSGPVSGRVPRSVPRTSLPITGKARAPSPPALLFVPRPRPQVTAPTCSPDRGGRTRGSSARRTASLASHALPGRPSGAAPLHPGLGPRASGSHDTPRRPPYSQNRGRVKPLVQTRTLRPREGMRVARGRSFPSSLFLFPSYHTSTGVGHTV